MGTVQAERVPVDWNCQSSPTFCGIAEIGAASFGIGMPVTIPAEFAVNAASVDSPLIASAASRSTAEARRDSVIEKAIFTGAAGITSPSLTEAGAVVSAFNLTVWVRRFSPAAITEQR